jgi:hypothetical protein
MRDERVETFDAIGHSASGDALHLWDLEFE